MSALWPVVRHRLHLVLCALASVWAWEPLSGTVCGILQYSVVCLVVFAVYELNRVTDLAEDALNCPEESAAAVRSRVLLVTISALCAAGALGLCAVLQNVRAVMIVAAVLLVGFLYSVPVLPVVNRPRLKSWFPLKTISVAAGWTALTVLYPVEQGSHPLGSGVSAGIFLMMSGAVGLQIICDLRDMPGDRAAGIRTLPVRIGIPRTVAYLKRLNAGVGAIILIFTATGILPISGLVLLLAVAMYGWLFHTRSLGFWEKRSTAPAVIGGQVVLLFLQGAVMRSW